MPVIFYASLILFYVYFVNEGHYWKIIDDKSEFTVGKE